MEWVKLIAVVGMLGRAIYTDVKRGIIENRNILAGLITAFVCSAWNSGINGLYVSGKMLVCTFGVLFLLYLLKGLGAGDIKLICVLSVFYPDTAVEIVAGSFLAAAGISAGKLLVRLVQKEKVYVPGETMAFSIPVGIGTGMALIQQYWG